MVLCAMFVALIAVGAFITIHIPIVPLSLQDMFVLLAAVLLGPKWGCLSVCIYLVMGLAGIPIFTQGGGIGYLLRPTFGYLLGYIPGSYLVGYLTSKYPKPTFKQILFPCFLRRIFSRPRYSGLHLPRSWSHQYKHAPDRPVLS